MGTITRGLANSVTTGGKVVSTSLSGTVAASNVNNESLDSVTAFASSLGDFVETRASDLSASPTTRGQLFYNTTDGVLKGVRLGTAAWAAGGNLIAGQRNAVTFGIQTSAVFAGGHTPGGTPTNSETYNGISWTEGNNLGAPADYAASAGTETAGVAFGGSPPDGGANNDTQEYDGTNWSEGNNLNTGRYSIGGSGTQTAALAAGGSPPGNTGSNLSEEYNGTNWTEGNNLGTARYKTTQFGTQTAAVAAGGDTGPANVNNVEHYDGTSWTAATVYPSTLTFAASAGTQTDGLVFLGDLGPAYGATTNTYDGTSWAASATLANAGGNTEGDGTGALALAASGGPQSGRTDGSEEFTGAVQTIKTLTTA